MTVASRGEGVEGTSGVVLQKSTLKAGGALETFRLLCKSAPDAEPGDGVRGNEHALVSLLSTITSFPKGCAVVGITMGKGQAEG